LKGIAYFPTATTIQVRRKATDKILLPACTKDGVSVSGLAEFEIDESVEDLLAFVRARGMPVATR
jgi:hypothetical protein